MSSLENQIAVITGASSGIGKSIALALSNLGVQLCLLGRNPEKLEVVAKVARKVSPLVRCYCIDLSTDDDILKLSEKLKVSFKRIDLLIHCAGVIFIDRLEFASVQKFDLQYKINVRAPFLLTQKLLPIIRLGQGQIVFINSSAVMNAGVNNGQYAATKIALKTIADCFRMELNHEGIRVLSIYPGRTATAMQKDVSKMEGKEYNPNLLLQSEDIAVTVLNALRMPDSAEITDISIRPLIKSN